MGGKYWRRASELSEMRELGPITPSKELEDGPLLSVDGSAVTNLEVLAGRVVNGRVELIRFLGILEQIERNPIFSPSHLDGEIDLLAIELLGERRGQVLSLFHEIHVESLRSEPDVLFDSAQLVRRAGGRWSQL